jgi:hypothetical protein
VEFTCGSTRKPWCDCATRHVAEPEITQHLSVTFDARLRSLAASHYLFIHVA